MGWSPIKEGWIADHTLYVRKSLEEAELLGVQQGPDDVAIGCFAFRSEGMGDEEEARRKKQR